MKNMLTKVLTLLLLVLVTQQSFEYALTPAIPPLAFLQQYYTCQLRVQGLTRPTYFYQGLPHFFTGSSSGRIQGIPTEQGNYQVTVTYQEDELIDTKVIILRVADSSQYGVDASYAKEAVISQVQSQSFTIPPSLYMQYEDINIDLRQYVPGNNTWSYQFLPLDLDATRQGKIKGAIGNKGIYSFAAVCSDQRGVSSSYIFTLNIQSRPLNYYNSLNYQLVTVPVRDTCSCDATNVWDLQRAADKAIEKALREAKQAKLIVDTLKAIIIKANEDADMAEQTLAVTGVFRNKLLHKQSEALKDTLKTKEWQKQARNHFDLMVTHYQQHERDVERQLADLKKAQADFNSSKKLFDEAGDVFKRAQQQTEQTFSLIAKLELDIVGYKKDVEDFFYLVRDSKKNLLQAQKTLSSQNIDIDHLYDNKDIANMQNDLAISNYHLKEDIANKDAQQLKKANQDVQDLKDRKANAGYDLGVEKFNLQQAMNKLLVAQAAKEASDKAVAIASAQLKEGQLDGFSTYVFGGCEQAGYPSYAGSARVDKVQSDKAWLDNGHYILFGDCTQKGSISEGDLVTFEGYLKKWLHSWAQVNQVIHLLTLLPDFYLYHD